MFSILRRIKNKTASNVRGLQSTLRFFRNYRYFLATGKKTIEHSDLLMMEALLFTNGRSNELAARWVQRANPPLPVEDREGIIDPLDSKEIGNAVAALQQDGIYIFPRRVHPEICSQLLEFARNTPCYPRADYLGGQLREKVGFDPAHLKAPMYQFDRQDIALNPAAQLAFLDPSIWRVAQSYLQVEPVLDLFALFWTAAFADRPDSESAQMYHFDMDRLKWLKFFIYLTDVGPNNGPHVFLRGTHRGFPRALRYYGRIPDEKVYQHWPRERALEVLGPAGTMFVADTRGFHKGKPVESGCRLVFDVEFATDLYGTDYPPTFIDERFSTDFIEVMKKHPRVFSAFVKKVTA